MTTITANAPEPAFRYARQADAPTLVALIERAYRSPDTAGSWVSEAHLLTGPRTSNEEISTIIAREDSRFLIAEIGGKLAGCCLLQGLSREPAPGSAHTEPSGAPNGPSATPGIPDTAGVNAAYFGMFAIEPNTHGAGLGKQVIAEAERRVRDLWDANQMVMTVINLRTALIAWYERRGYHATGATLPFPFTETSGETTRDFHLVEMRKTLTA
jgi:ribosomal protein S18 acetylase RimI-like enzyme